MKILWFVNNLCEAVEYLKPDTQACGWLYSLCQHLRKQDDIELHIAFLWNGALSAFTYKDVVYHPVSRKGINTRWGRYLMRMRNLFVKPNDTRELRICLQIIDEVQPDIIHIHGSEDMFGLITQSKKVKCPVVLSMQGLLSSCRLKYYSGITRDAISRKEPIIKKLLLSGYNGVYRDFSERADREIVMFKTLKNVIGRTQWDRRGAQSLNPNIRYYQVNEILRPEFFSTEWNGQHHECFTIVTTISSGIFKGLEVIYEAAKMLKNTHVLFQWNIVGITQDDEMVKLVEKVCNIKHQDVNVDFLGQKLADGVAKILLQSDLYVQVSHIENSPNSVCEAMALGMPIIASFVGGTSSMLKDGEEGVLIQDGNPFELAGAVMEAKQDYAHAIQMAKNARKRALKRHQPENVVNELMAVYHSIIDSSK